MSDSPAGRRARPKKKRPNVFANTFANVISGAEEVVEASFIASGVSSEAPSPPASGSGAAAPAAVPVPVSAPPQPPRVLLSQPVPAARPQKPAQSADVEAAAESAAPRAPTVVRAPAVAPPPAAAPQGARPRRAGTGEERQKPTRVAEAVAEAVAEEHAVEERSAPMRRGAAPGHRTGQLWAHQALFESFTSAAIDSKSWSMYGFRLLPDVFAALKARMNADRRSSGNQKLAISHYLDAALRHAPVEVEEQVASAQAFLTERMGMVEAGRQSTYRVGPQAAVLVSGLNTALQEADHGRNGIYVVNAALEGFLQALDAAGELKRPDLPGAS